MYTIMVHGSIPMINRYPTASAHPGIACLDCKLLEVFVAALYGNKPVPTMPSDSDLSTPPPHNSRHSTCYVSQYTWRYYMYL